MSKTFHARAAFHYTCWSSGEFHCGRGAETRRDCSFDRRRTAYRGAVRAPTNLPDGEYVLGFVWFGGYVGDNHSQYGDYYDCARVRIRGGGRVTPSHTPTFWAGQGEWADSCRASVNAVGTCWREPCHGYQGGRMKPVDFSNGARPRPISSALFYPRFDASRLDRHAPSPQRSSALTAPGFNPFAAITVGAPVALDGISLLHPPAPRVVWGYLPLRPPPLPLPQGGVSLSAQARGDVRQVEWYVNGRRVRVEKAFPYTIAGDKRGSVFVWRRRWGGAGPVHVRVRVVGIRGRAVERTWFLRFYR